MNNLATALKTNGCKVMVRDEKTLQEWEKGLSDTYFFFSFPNDSKIFSIQFSTFLGAHIDMSIEYIPTKGNGSGCQLQDYMLIDNITFEDIKTVYDEFKEKGYSAYVNMGNIRNASFKPENIRYYKGIEEFYNSYHNKEKWYFL